MHHPTQAVERVLLTLIVLTIASLACRPTQPDTPTPPAPSPTPSAPIPTLAPTDAPPTAEPPADASPTAPEPTPPPPTDAPQDLAILSFSADVEEIPTGKRVTLTWQTTGAIEATIWAGTSRRFPQAWQVEPNGTLTVELTHTNFRDPDMMLVAYDAQENQVSESVIIEWACEYDYFFETELAACPRYEPSQTWAAEQPFENGRMIWLEEIEGADFTAQGLILVLYEDGAYEQYEDTWAEGDPEDDPEIVPPEGLLQPIRGFGKLWRENDDLRERLGWATAPEQGFDTVWQQQIRESIPSVAYVRTLEGQVVRIEGWGWQTGGSWSPVGP